MPKKTIGLTDIMNALSQTLAEEHEGLILDEWADRKTAKDHHTFGLCYVASETLWRLSKEFKAQNPDIPDLKVCKATIGDDNHYWTQDKKTGEIYDLTAEQFAQGQYKGAKGRKVLAALYEAGKGTGLMACSNRAKEAMAVTKSKLAL